jgi:hypothetical protein
VTAKTKEGKEIYKAQKIYMPQSSASRGEDKMVYGPFRKVGMLRDTSLQPLQTKVETFEIFFPVKEVEKDGKKMRELETKEMIIDVELWYLPAGVKGVVGKDQFLFNKTTRTVVLR